jgi:hypothetical protein
LLLGAKWPRLQLPVSRFSPCPQSLTVLAAHPKLNYTPDERKLFGQLFRECDESGTNIVTGDAAVKLFQRSRIAEAVLGEVRVAMSKPPC